MTETPADLIERWRAQYERANGRAAPAMTYVRGLFILRDPLTSRRRRRDVEDMVFRLSARPDAPPR